VNHDALEQGMFWAGALMAFVPIIFAGVVLSVWWYQRKKAAKRPQTPADT
jgi:prepilin signal peptidase PulO-like enzyme (type II secretory pathway)